MEAIQLLTTLILAIIVSFALYRRRSTGTARSLHPLPPVTIKVRDAAVARQTLIEQADAFSNRPATPFPVPLITGRRQSPGLTTVPYGPHWRALRSSLNASMLQPWRQGLLSPLQHDAVDALVAGLHQTHARSAADVVVVDVRDSVSPAAFAMVARVCFGDDDVDASHVRSMQRMIQEFRVAIGEARVLARSAMAKLRHWRKWRRFLAFRSRQAALFVPLIEARRRRLRMSSSGSGDGAGAPLRRRPYVDLLIEQRIPDENHQNQNQNQNQNHTPAVAVAKKRALTDDEIVSLVVELFGVAEATVTALEWTLAHLVNRPDVQAKLRRELVSDHKNNPAGGESTSTYLHAVVLEVLRLHPPFPLVMREVHYSDCAAAVVVGTAAVPAGGARVQFILGDIGKDETLWTDPGEFRPERFLPGGEGEGVGLVPAGGLKEIRMMPFGAGQRACPGAALGVQYIKGFLAALVREFQWAPAPPDDGGGAGAGVDMTELYGFITVMKSPLRAHITPRPRGVYHNA